MTAAQAGGVGDIDAPHDRDRGSGQGHRGVLEVLEGVVTLSVVYGASIKQPGDVVTVHVLNREVDAVLAVVAQAQQFGPVSVSTAEVQSILGEHAARVIAGALIALALVPAAALVGAGQVAGEMVMALEALGGWDSTCCWWSCSAVRSCCSSSVSSITTTVP